LKTGMNRASWDIVSYLFNAAGEYRHTAENSSMGNRHWSEETR
jgi:hypothetical protein